jgi:two-component system, chemotaxis family, protein-glutamate methylesterase/glutaminase
MNSGKTVLIGGSAGSFKVVTGIIASIPADFHFSVILCLHRLKNVRNGFAEAISANNKLKIREPFHNEALKPGIIYLAPSNYHLMVENDKTFSLSVDEVVNHSRPSIDILFDTAAEVFGNSCIGILLSGANSDGAKGMMKLKKAGALTIVQDPGHAEISSMPKACLDLITPDYVMNPMEIINYISTL